MGERYGGRAKGTPNKSTQKVRDFLDDVFSEVFADPEFRKLLVERIRTLSIDGRLLTTLLQHYAGRPSQAIDVAHSGSVTLAQLIAGRVPKDEDEEEEPDGTP